MIKFSKKFDCFFDSVKDEWVEEKCVDVNCLFCKTRPDKPSLVKKSFFRKCFSWLLSKKV